MANIEGSIGQCIALKPTSIWSGDNTMTNAEGCATLDNNPVACHNYGLCTWKANSGQTPDNYDAQIQSLGNQYSQYLEQQAQDCSKFLGLGTDEDACNTRCLFTECLPHTKGKWRGKPIRKIFIILTFQIFNMTYISKSFIQRRFPIRQIVCYCKQTIFISNLSVVFHKHPLNSKALTLRSVSERALQVATREGSHNV